MPRFLPPSFFPSLVVAWILVLPLPAQGTSRVSVDSAGLPGNGVSQVPAISADGRYVAFSSASTNLGAGATTGQYEIYVHDRQSGQTTLVSMDSSGHLADRSCTDPAISADGRYVAFASEATNLVPGDTNGVRDIFRHDRSTGVTIRVSVDSAGIEGGDRSESPAISADGRFVYFYSWARNLVPGDTNSSTDVFRHDCQTGQTIRLSVNASGVEGNGSSDSPSVSADGQLIAFSSFASNLDPGGSLGKQIFVRDLQSGQTSLVSTDSSGVQGNAGSFIPSISGDGRYVAFYSWATNLVPGDTNGSVDVFVHDRLTGQTTRASVDSSGIQGDSFSVAPALSADGRYVAFHSAADNLVPGDTNGVQDVFVHDQQTGQTTRVSVNSSGVEADDLSFLPAISGDGQNVVFSSYASNLTPTGSHSYAEIFLHGGPLLSASGSCPGSMSFTVTGATPGGQVAFVWGRTPGGFVIPPGNSCPGLELDLLPGLNPPTLLTVSADSLGVASASGTVPAPACGVFAIQALDLVTCGKSNLVPF